MTKNPLAKKLRNHKLVLASGSPRRKKFFEDLGIDFEIRLKPIEEVYPEALKGKEISAFLAELKATAFKNKLKAEEILITSDTVVWHNNESLAKPKDRNEAIVMLQKLSGQWHEVITAVSFTTIRETKTINVTTKVKLTELSLEEIEYYVKTFNPHDKAGAYGIQEWIGTIGIERIEGSYNNVVGLPTHTVYKTLMNMVN